MSSLSKACFVYKKKTKKKSPATSPIKKGPADNAEEGLRARRLSLFSKTWKTVEEQVQDLHSHTHGRVLGDLVSFVEGASLEMDLWRTNQIIPTATLIAGVNMPDHNAVFATLRNEIVKRVTPLVVFLTSKDAANIKTLISRLVSSLLSIGVEDDEEEEEKEGNEASAKDEYMEQSPVKRNQLTMPVLASWYFHLVAGPNCSASDGGPTASKLQRMTSPRKTARTKPENGDVSEPAPAAIVVVLRDLEAFPADVLQRFVAILSDYFDRLPFIFVFGVSTRASAIHDILTRSTSSKLAIETFAAQNPTSYLDVILKKILISSKFHFKLSQNVFRLFEDVFLFNDLSVKTFVSGYKYCMMEHYFENPLSVLCCDWDTVEKRIRRMDSESMECVRRLGSFRSFVEKQPCKEQRALLLDDGRLKEVMRSLFHDYHRYHYDFFPVLYCLHAVVADLPKFPLGKQLRETYFACLEGDIAGTQDFEDSMNLLNLMARDELVDRLTRGCEAIQSCVLPSLAVSVIRRSLEGIVHRMELAEQSTWEDDVEGERQAINGTNVQEALPKRMDRFELQQRLKLEMAAKSERQKRRLPASVSLYASLREEAVAVLRQAAKKFLVCPKRLPLYEIFYFDSVTSVQPQLIGGSRAALQMALANPHSYFKCDCCALKEDGSILGTFPDVCISYKLHLECGILINLYDWLQAFIMIAEQADSRKTSSKNRRPTDQLM